MAPSASDTYRRMSAVATAKLNAPWGVQLLQGLLAGGYIGLGGLHANRVEAGLSAVMSSGLEASVSREHGAGSIANVLGGAVFPVGLIAIFLTGANLFTGNCMYVVPPLLNRTVGLPRALGFLALSWLTNFLGAVFVAYFVACNAATLQTQAGMGKAWANLETLAAFACGADRGEFFSVEPYQSFVAANAQHKCDIDWGVAFARGIGANWLVCLGWWQAIASDVRLCSVPTATRLVGSCGSVALSKPLRHERRSSAASGLRVHHPNARG